MSLKLIFLCSLPFVGLCLGYAVVWYANKPTTMVCPSFIGTQSLDALLKSSTTQLKIDITHTLIDDSLPEGTIIQQIPRPGSLIKKNQTIYVTVTLKSDFKIPDLRGEKKSNPLCITTQKECTMTEYSLPSVFPVDTIFAQHPLSGTYSTKKEVVVYVSSPEATMHIFPQLCGHNLADVKEFLNFNQIPYTLICKKEGTSSTMVVHQQPIAGSIISIKGLKMVYLECS